MPQCKRCGAEFDRSPQAHNKVYCTYRCRIRSMQDDRRLPLRTVICAYDACCTFKTDRATARFCVEHHCRRRFYNRKGGATALTAQEVLSWK